MIAEQVVDAAGFWVAAFDRLGVVTEALVEVALRSHVRSRQTPRASNIVVLVAHRNFFGVADGVEKNFQDGCGNFLVSETCNTYICVVHLSQKIVNDVQIFAVVTQKVKTRQKHDHLVSHLRGDFKRSHGGSTASNSRATARIGFAFGRFIATLITEQLSHNSRRDLRREIMERDAQTQ